MTSQEEHSEVTNEENKQLTVVPKSKLAQLTHVHKNIKHLIHLIYFNVFLMMFIIFSTVFALAFSFHPTIAKGVSVKGINLSNLTLEEAHEKLEKALNIELQETIQLYYDDDYKIDFLPEQINYKYDIDSIVREAFDIGRTNNILLSNYKLLYATFWGIDLEISATYNEELLQDIVDDIAVKLPGVVVQPSHYLEEENLIISSGKSGLALKKDALKESILNNIKTKNYIEILNKNSNFSIIKIQVENANPNKIDIEQIYNEVHCDPQDAYFSPEPLQIFKEQDGVDFAISLEEAQKIIDSEEKDEYSIPLKFTPAEKTIDSIGLEAFPYLISTFKTYYDAKNTNRSGNLKLAADKINGTVLMPGEVFSFNEVVGKRTIEAGYKNAKIYENGQVVDGLAGGICQISSTLYNAALLANLQIVERRNHSFTSTYVKAGLDATVVYGVTDFKFKNTRSYPIKIECSVEKGIAIFNIHGNKEENEYEIKLSSVTTQVIPYQTVFIQDPTLVPGQQIVSQSGHPGYKVTTYIEKILNGVSISKEILSNDTYNAMKTIIRVGP